MNSCVPELELQSFSKGELSPNDTARVQTHLAQCPTCYAKQLRGERDDTGEVATGAVLSPRWTEELPADVRWEPGTDLGRYVILRTLGEGGMGVVFRAYDKELDRAVALKVLHTSEEDGNTTGGPTRLLREAQAMARLSHPNVVAVHDVVVLERRVCVVMELVEGVTLREWLKTEPRPDWKAIVGAFRAAGEGLAAAHDARLVHRDFKPDNVLVGRDGRIRVTDFGIARLASDSAGDNGVSEAMTAALGAGAGLKTSITTEGQVVGTPRYMAPEQFEKAPADFRTDQFSFGVALYEALYGEHAYEGKSLVDRLAKAKAGIVRPPPSSTNVPPWIHRVVVRALSADPERRFPSMRALTEELSRDPSHRRNRALVAAGLAVALALGAVAAVSSARARVQLCTGAELKLAGVWDPARREQVRAAFAATGLPFAGDSFELAAKVLDGYTAQWVSTHREACEATRLRGEQSDQVLTLRMSCLQQRLDALSATTDMFAQADPTIVGKAKQSLDALPSLGTCSDVAHLSAKLPPPDEPAVVAQVERIRKDLTRSRVLLDLGRLQEAQALSAPAFEAAQRTGYSPVIGEAELSLAMVKSNEGAVPEAIALATSAFSRALADGHDELLTTAAHRLAQLGVRKRTHDRAMQWASFAEAANQRSKDTEVFALVENVRGNVARNEGDFVTAAKHYGLAAERARSSLGPEHMTTLGTTYNSASAMQNLGRYREAEGVFDAVLAAARRTLGNRHPFLAYPLVGAGNVAFNLMHLEKSKASFEEVLVITGGKGANADNAYTGLGEIAALQGRYEEALAFHQKALEVEEALEPGGPETLSALTLHALVQVRMGRHDEAMRTFEDVIGRAEKMEDAFDAISDARRGMAIVLLARNQPAKALQMAEECVKVLIPTRGKSHPVTLDARLLAAKSRFELGRTNEATAAAQEVLAEALVQLPERHEVVVSARELLARAGAEVSAVP